MGAPENLLSNYQKIAYTSYYDTDKIIGDISGSMSVAAPTALAGSFKTTTVTSDTGFGTSCYFKGIFSTDSGATWNDLGCYVPNLSGAPPGDYQTTTCRAYVTSAGILTIVGINWYQSAHGVSASKTIQYRIVLIAKQNQGVITPLPTTGTSNFDSRNHMPKIYLAGTFAASTTLNTTITHNLGFAANVDSFFEPTGATSGIEGVASVPAGAMMSLDWFKGGSSGISADAQMGNNSVDFTPVQSNASTPNGIAGTQHYIIYLDV